MNENAPLAVGLREFPVTLALVAICVGLFIWQVVTGVDASHPSTSDLVNWGANFLPFSLGGQPWRLVTNLFLHIGLLHLMFNMFALYYFGQVAERMFGKLNFLLLFTLAGIGGNLLNNFWGIQQVLVNELPAVSAGASGGIMGIGMALLVVALSKKSINGLRLSAKSLIWVMAINLGYGFVVGGIDNAGHIGGAITGAVLAVVYIFAFSDKPLAQTADFPTDLTHSAQSTHLSQSNGSTRSNQTKVWLAYGVILLALVLIYWQLHEQFAALLAATHAQITP